jgi:PBP1b-binding outer membrane lipoprotein LpoB
VPTDRPNVPDSTADVTTRDNETGTCKPIDTAISPVRNVIKEQAEKILQYEDLSTEIQDMWNVKTKGMLVITEAAATMPK